MVLVLTITLVSCYKTDESSPTVVTIPNIVTNITVSPDQFTVVTGSTKQFSAVVHSTNDTSPNVNWSVTGGGSGTSINNNGLLTVSANETATLLTVKATLANDNTKSGDASVTVLTPTVGDPGPGGGYIFYDKGSYSNGWRFLEAAPASSERTAQWGLNGIACPGTSESIGSGQANTTAIINLLNANGQSGRAAQICDALTINGYSDWFLPSKDELNQMYLRLRVGNNIGGFVISDNSYPYSYYWSSTAYNATSLYYTWLQRFSDGGQSTLNYDGNYRNNELRVRGVRAF